MIYLTVHYQQIVVYSFYLKKVFNWKFIKKFPNIKKGYGGCLVGNIPHYHTRLTIGSFEVG